MENNQILLLSTRPLDEAVIERAAFQKIVIKTTSFIQVKKSITDQVKDRIDTLSKENATAIFTSMNAVDIVVETAIVDPNMPNWKIYCIGGATFTLVKKYWPYSQVKCTARDSTELADAIIRDNVTNAVFFCGNKRREELPDILHQQNIDVEELMVYETIETPSLVEEMYHGILFFSPSAVESFFSTNTPTKSAILFAIGNTTAKAIQQFSTNSIIISDFPAKDQLVDKAIKYFQQAQTII